MSTGGLDGAEGTFLVCTFWLVQALAQHGDDERAGAVFERALAVSNDVGLLAEEYDVKHERMVSNFPQASSDLGLLAATRSLEILRAHGPLRDSLGTIGQARTGLGQRSRCASCGRESTWRVGGWK
jgi:hypothetical protein